MKLHDFIGLMLCCSALWVGVHTQAAVPSCDSGLSFAADVSSTSEGNGNIHARSLSPWKWKRVVVKHQIPSVIWEAECSSRFCSGPNEAVRGFSLNSVPIYQNLLVLRRKEGAEKCYSASYVSVAVGCTCVWARVSEA